MDVESFFDTCCVKEAGIEPCAADCCAEGIGTFLQILDEYQIPATMFVTTDSLDYTLPYLQVAKQKGHVLAFHATEHVSTTNLSLQQFEDNLQRGIQIMSETFGEQPKGYRAPCFGLNNEQEKVVEKYFTYDSSNLGFQKALNSASFSMQDFTQKSNVVYQKGNFYEFRPCVGRLLFRKFPLSGGGYLRLVPWVFLSHAVKRYIRTHNDFLFYVHPFELCSQKISCVKKLAFHNRLYVNIGRRTYAKKIKKIICLLKQEGYQFINSEEYIKQEGMCYGK
jgi:peptidoglycan/xylan/chitin deacetylase (PgdA/CDA1 family)